MRKIGTKYKVKDTRGYEKNIGLEKGDVVKYAGYDEYYRRHVYELPSHLKDKGHMGLLEGTGKGDFIYMHDEYLEMIQETPINVFKHFNLVSKVKLHIIDKNVFTTYETTLEVLPDETLDEINDILNKNECQVKIYGKIGGELKWN